MFNYGLVVIDSLFEVMSKNMVRTRVALEWDESMIFLVAGND